MADDPAKEKFVIAKMLGGPDEGCEIQVPKWALDLGFVYRAYDDPPKARRYIGVMRSPSLPKEHKLYLTRNRAGNLFVSLFEPRRIQ